jgi:excisionase family DNA binding protein
MDKTLEAIKNLEALILNQNILRKTFLTIDEAAIYIGLEKTTLYRYCSDGKLDYYKPNKKNVYFRRTDLDDFLEKSKQKSKRTIDNEVDDYFKSKK